MSKNRCSLRSGERIALLILTACVLTLSLFYLGTTLPAYAVSSRHTVSGHKISCPLTDVFPTPTGSSRGIHPLITVGPAASTPTMTLHPRTGFGGDFLYLKAAGFTMNESVQVYWGDTSGFLEGSPAADRSGNLAYSFYAPPDLAPGTYLVTVLRNHLDMSTITASFQVIRPCMSATSSIGVTQPIYVALGRFQPGETVTLSWSANGGQQLGTTRVDIAGYGSGVFHTPMAPFGSYTVSAVGNSSGLQVTQSLVIVSPAVQILSITNGQSSFARVFNFLPYESVNVSWSAHGGQTLSTVTTDNSGYGSTYIMPPFTQPGTYTVTATGLSSTFQATSIVQVEPPSFLVASASYHVGQNAVVTLQGFQPEEVVTITWDVGRQQLASVQMDATGSLTTQFLIPTATWGVHMLTATGSFSGLTAGTSVSILGSIQLSTSNAAPGSIITVSGTGFKAAETVNIDTQTTNKSFISVVVTTTTDGLGSFTLSYQVPTIYKKNTYPYIIDGVGITDSTEQASAPFAFIPAGITSNVSAVHPGDTVTISGQGFVPNVVVSIIWNYKQYWRTLVGTVTPAGDGSFSLTFTVPSLYSSTNVIVYAVDVHRQYKAYTNVYEYGS